MDKCVLIHSHWLAIYDSSLICQTGPLVLGFRDRSRDTSLIHLLESVVAPSRWPDDQWFQHFQVSYAWFSERVQTKVSKASAFRGVLMDLI